MTERIKITLRGLPHIDGDLTMWSETCEDGVTVLINDFPVVSVDMQYCGLPIGHTDPTVPDDPCDPSNTPKVVVGSWPAGEEWERLVTFPMTTVNEGLDAWIETSTPSAVDLYRSALDDAATALQQLMSWNYHHDEWVALQQARNVIGDLRRPLRPSNA